MTTGTINWQENSAYVGQTIHADYTWTGAVKQPDSEWYVDGYIIDPTENDCSYFTSVFSTGSYALSCVANMVGIWKAQMFLYDGNDYMVLEADLDVIATDLICDAGSDIDTYAGTIRLSATASGGSSPYDYYWSFGDNNYASGPTVEHYFYPGTYTVLLSVSDASGNICTDSLTANFNSSTPSGKVWIDHPIPCEYILGSTECQSYDSCTWGGFCFTDEWVVGDTIKVGFIWSEALQQPPPQHSWVRARGYLVDPDGIERDDFASEKMECPEHSPTYLSSIADKDGLWYAYMILYDGYNFLTIAGYQYWLGIPPAWIPSEINVKTCEQLSWDGVCTRNGCYWYNDSCHTKKSKNDYILNVQVSNITNNTMINGAMVSVGTNSQTTSINGNVQFTLPIGQYILTISKSGYNTYRSSISVSGDAVMPIKLTPMSSQPRQPSKSTLYW